MKKVKWFKSKPSADKKEGQRKKSEEHDESSDQVETARKSIGDGPSDVVDAMPAGVFVPGKTQSMPKPTPTPTPTSSANILPNPGVSRDGEEYSMCRQKRGVAMIFSHENFDSRAYDDELHQLPDRKGTQIDRDALRHTFEDLGFDVRCFDDLCYYQINNELRGVAHQDHRNYDCVAVAVLTHGERDGKLHAKDRDYYVSELWEPFTARQCPTLAGKPKLFFIQACKGDGLDQGVNVSSTLRDVADSSPVAFSYPVPSYADILVSYSTFEGLYSYLNTKNGSWYVQTLCSHLTEHGKTMDLMSLLTEVNRVVGQEFRVKNKSEPRLQGMVQAPSFTSSLTRRLRFR
ncbi:caspase-1-like isoform X2 [Schistocerca americana]|uniref:caspase-1-like isoform X2 n=1 Tax=Schistocerca americana TaxID=7009 RepID=UPI001F501AEB|nr:caspase-1-like isoform X2 [Schistocerca americana]